MLIKLPDDTSAYEQNEEHFYLSADKNRKILLHDYTKIFAIEGLYEEVFHKSLGCTSPNLMGGLIISEMLRAGIRLDKAKILEIAPGNGCLGHILKSSSVTQIIGFDNNHNAKIASQRDNPNVYSEYIVGDDIREEYKGDTGLDELDCLICCSALDFNHVKLDDYMFMYDKALKRYGICGVNVRDSDIQGCIRDTLLSRLTTMEESGELSMLIDVKYVHRITTYGRPVNYRAILFQKGG